MTERIQEFLRNRRSEGQDTEPCLVVDLEVVRDNYQTFAKALPDSRVFYAVKANPSPEVLSLLASMGSCFDTATVAEIEMALAAGATPDRISYGNTIKKERDIARAFALGIRLFAVDCSAEVEKIARAAPGAKVFCRILYDCAGAEWPLSRKFGCDPEMAVDVLDLAKRLGLEPCGISFHVGSQQRKVKAWDRALAMASTVFRDCAERGISLSMVRPVDLPCAAQAFRQPDPGNDYRAGPRHGRKCRHHRDRSRSDLQEERRGRGALGVSRHRQVRRSRRDDGRVDPLRHPHPA
jgi:ornithine decarboxylase